MKSIPVATYEVDARWRIVAADAAFCRLFRSTEPGLIGRDVRELLREDFRLDFRRYVARALVGIGQLEGMIPMVAPCGDQRWVKHVIEPLSVGGMLSGFKAQVQGRQVAKPGQKPWWHWRPATPHLVWDSEVDRLAAAG